MNLFFASSILIFILALAGGFYGLFLFKYLRTSFRWLAVFLVFSGLAQILAVFVGRRYGTNELYSNLITPVYYILSYLIFAHFSKDKRTLIFNNVLFIIGAVFLFIFLAIDINQGILSKKAISIGNFVFSLAAFIFFFDMIKSPLKTSPLKMPKFYFLFAFLFYHSSIIFFWAAEALFKDYISKFSMAYLNIAMLFIYYCILIIALGVEIKSNRLNGS